MGSSRRWKRAKQLAQSRGHDDGQFEMAEILLDFAEPLLDSLELPRDRSAFVGSVKTAAVLWNAMMDPPADGYRSIYAKLGRAVGSAPTRELENVFDLMIARGTARYSHLRRKIATVDVEVHDDGRCTVRVVALL